jgi:hypothetical protein
MISIITRTCTDGQHLNEQYDHNDFQVDVPDSIGVSNFRCLADMSLQKKGTLLSYV